MAKKNKSKEEKESLEVAELLELEEEPIEEKELIITTNDTVVNELLEKIAELPEINKEKHDRFLRLAKPRTQKVLYCLKILGNCSNKSSYAYTEEEVLKIFDTIKETIIEIENKFSERLVTQKALFEF